MNPRRTATLTAILCGTGLVAWLAGFGSASFENTAATLDRLAPLLAADLELAVPPQPTAMGNPGIGNLDVATAAELVTATATDATATPDERDLIVTASIDPSQLLPEAPVARVATAST